MMNERVVAGLFLALRGSKNDLVSVRSRGDETHFVQMSRYSPCQTYGMMKAGS
jgi:hypothetical protein